MRLFLHQVIHRVTLFSLVSVLAMAPGCSDRSRDDRASHETQPPSTFSIVAVDLDSGDIGVAVASRFFGVGSVVPWARAGVGAVATQSYANTTFGPAGLQSLEAGSMPRETLDALLSADAGRERRQVAIVDARGRVAAYTGAGCFPWAGHREGKGYSVQGNLLVSKKTIDAMAASFERTAGPLSGRLLSALEAGEAAGGDARGQQSAALYVVRKGGGYGRFNDRLIQLHVEDHPDPVAELRRLHEMKLRRDPVSRAAALRRRGQWAEALKTTEEGLKEHPRWIDLQIEKARSFAAAGKPERVKEALIPIEERAETQPQLLLIAARIHARAGSEKEAERCLQRLIQLNSEYREVLAREKMDRKSPIAPLLRRMAPAGKSPAPKTPAPKNQSQASKNGAPEKNTPK